MSDPHLGPPPHHPEYPSSRKKDMRRRGRRCGAGLILSCHRAGETRKLSGWRPNLAIELRDIGWGGLQFIATEPLRPPCPLSIQVKDPSTGDLLHARGSVAWSDTRRGPDGEIHVVGVQFNEIFTPTAKCAWFFREPERPPPARVIALSPDLARPRRRRERFQVDDCFVSVSRETPYGTSARPTNLAFRLVDVSASGAQVVCTDPLDPGMKVRFILHLNTFANCFQASAEVIWVRRTAGGGGRAWNLGLQFKQLDVTAAKQIEYMMQWLAAKRENDRRME